MKQLWLTVEDTDTPPRPLPDTGTLVIGSSRERADLLVTGTGVDSAHCAVGRVKGGGWALKDLGSPSGTRLNGKSVTSARLAAGDTLELGSARLTVIEAGAPADRAAAEPEPPTVGSGAGNGGSGAAPQRIGGYRVLRVLGRGGMGTVHLAVQESLEREVALKVLSPKLAADRDFVTRFQSEARAAAALSHPNVVVVHDVGEADGCHYLSMEYMQRGCLESRLRAEGQLPWREALTVLRDAASGLVFAEERGVVHRDIKPANLMQNAVGTTKIADLGLATSVEAEVAASGGRKIFGTPHFIAPEQARGESVDSRSDLYSLGATAYRLISGRTPFEGDTTKDILRAVLRESPAPLTESVPDLPQGVSELVQRLLAKDPADRPRSARDLVSELTHLIHAAGRAPSDTPSRHLPRLAVGVAVLALIGAGLWLALRSGAGGPGDSSGPDLDGANGAGSGTSALAAGTDAGPSTGAGQGAGDSATGAPVDLPGIAEEPGALAAETPDDTGAGSEAELELLELSAKLALSEARNLERDTERLEALRAVAADYPGATAASTAALEATALEAEMTASRERVAAARQSIEAYRERLAAATSVDATPAANIEAVRALPPPEAAVLDPEAAAAVRAGLEAELISRAHSRVLEASASADAAAERGDFAGARSQLEGVLPLYTGLTELQDLPNEVELLESTRLDVEAHLAGLPAEEAAFLLDRERATRGRLAEVLGAGPGLERQLASLDIVGLAATLEAASEGLDEPAVRSWTLALAGDLRAARRALDVLVREFDAGGWARRSVLDPRARRGGAREVVNAEPAGLWFERDGQREIVTWSEFGRSTRHLDQLFRDRLGRAWTASEEADVESLLYLSAVVEAADPAARRLEQNGGGTDGLRTGLPPWPEGALEDARSAFDVVAPWSERAGRSLRLAREREAFEALVTALDQIDAGAWPSAAALLESLLEEHGDTLFVALFRDGTPWRARSRSTAPAALPTDGAPGSGEQEPSTEKTGSGTTGDGALNTKELPLAGGAGAPVPTPPQEPDSQPSSDGPDGSLPPAPDEAPGDAPRSQIGTSATS